MSGSLVTLIETESASYGVPDWITGSLAYSESKLQPNAPGGGLFQITPVFPQPPGANLQDPKTNIDIALAQIGPYVKAHPQEQGESNLQYYERVISHTGFDTMQGWDQEGVGSGVDPAAVQQNYINGFESWPMIKAEPGPNPNPADLPSWAAGQAQQGVQQAACDAITYSTPLGVFYGPPICWIMGAITGKDSTGLGESSLGISPLKGLIFIVAIFILIAAAFKVVGGERIVDLGARAGVAPA